MNSKLLLLTIHLIFSITTFAQVDLSLNNEKFKVLEHPAVLIDNNYSFLEILKDSSLHFSNQSEISVKGIENYWIKCTVKNNSAYDKSFAIYSSPYFNSRLYFFNEDKNNWESVSGGEMLDNNQTIFKYVPCVFRSNKVTTFYMKVNVNEINKNISFLKPTITFEAQSFTVANRNRDFQWWLVTVCIVFAFLIYNIYWYLMIKEKVYLYYLIILAGGIIYITNALFFLSLFINIQSINAVVNPDGFVGYFPVEYVLMQLSICFILLGFVAFTRSYLQSKIHLPKWDKILKIVFQIFVVINITIAAGIYFKIIVTNNVYSFVLNILILLIIVLIFILGFKSFLQKRKEANYFLLALFLPLILMLTLAISIIISQKTNVLNFLPHLAILSITLTFAIALVAKVNLIKRDLTIEKLEKQTINASMAIEKERNFRLEEKIEYDKNEVIAAQQIKLLMKELHHRVKNNLQIISSLLSLQSFRIKDPAALEAVKEGQYRIEAMSLIHQRLYIQDNITQINIYEFISDIAESLMQAYGYNKNSFSLQINVTEQFLDVDKATPLSIIINELITNAFKYAYSGIEYPELKISFTKKFQNAELRITDNGTGIDINAWQTNDGYGKDLVQTFIEQLEGTLKLSVQNGTTFKILFPFN